MGLFPTMLNRLVPGYTTGDATLLAIDFSLVAGGDERPVNPPARPEVTAGVVEQRPSMLALKAQPPPTSRSCSRVIQVPISLRR